MYHLDAQCGFCEECCNTNIIHIIFAFLLTIFLIPRFKDGVHEALEGGRGITHSKEHDFWFKKPSACLEGSFPLITATNSNIIVSPSYIEFTEEFHALEIFNTFCKIWEKGNIFSSNGIE